MEELNLKEVERFIALLLEAKEKKIKAEKKAAPPKAPEGGKSRKTTESPAEGKTTTMKSD